MDSTKNRKLVFFVVDPDKNTQIDVEWSLTIWHVEESRIILEQLNKKLTAIDIKANVGIEISNEQSDTKIADEDHIITTIKITKWTVIPK